MRRVADVLLWVGAVLGALSLVTAGLVCVLGLVPLIFTSGSMSPEISSGSLGVARSVPAADLAVDDVVSVESAEGVRVTHRIVTLEETEDGALLTLKGDANREPDADPYPVAEADRMLFSVPWVGHVLSGLAHPLVLFGGGVLAAGVLFTILSSYRRSGGVRRAGRTEGPESGVDKADQAGGARRVAAGLLVAALPALVALQPAEPTMAAFSDTGGTVTTSGFVSHRVGQPTGATCSATSTQLTVGTTVTDPRYTYWAQAFTFGATGTSVSDPKQMTGTGTGTGTTRTTTFGTAEFSPPLTVGANYAVRVYARVANTLWQSDEYAVQPFSRTESAMTCGTAPTTPTLGFTEPVNLARHNQTTTASRLTQFCGSAYGSQTSAACGTVSDDGTIANVEYILQRTGLLVGTRCWNGSSWVTSCAYRSAERNTATNPQRWSVPRASNPYTAYADYALTIRATDNEGRVTTRTIYYAVALL